MKNSLLAALLGFALSCVGVCFVVDDVKADPVVISVEQSDHIVNAEAIALSDVAYVPILDVEHTISNEIFTDAEINETEIAFALTCEHQQRMWQERSWGDPQKDYTVIEKYPASTKRHDSIRINKRC